MDISVSILDLKEDRFVKDIYNLEEAGIISFHIDVMDGKFTESKNNIDNMYSKTSILNQVSIMKKDVHLMTYDLERNIDLFSFLEPDIITVHYEAIIKEYNLEKAKKEIQIQKIKEVMEYIQRKGIKARN
jgi:ribulose-phosphate 3-epimerase